MAKVSAILTAIAKERGVGKLNRELDKLFKTGQKLSKLKINIGGSTSQLNQTQRAISNISRDLAKLQSKRIRVSADVSGASTEIRTLNTLITGIKDIENIRITANTTDATADITALNTLVTSIKEVENIRINALTSDARANIIALNTLITNIKEVETIKINADVAAAIAEIERMQAIARQDQIFNVRPTGGVGGGTGADGGLSHQIRGLPWRGFGSQIGFGFRAAIGAGLAQGALGIAKEGIDATRASEAAQIRLRQAGFTETETADFVKMSREVQEKFPQVPAAAILDASVEQLTALKVAGKSAEDHRIAMERIARNSQIMAITYKDAAKGAEQARQAERISTIMGEDINDPAIRKIQEAAMRAVIASGGEMTIEEGVRVAQQVGSSIARKMSSQALTDLMLTREEGGRASTAEYRMAIQDLYRSTLDPAQATAMGKYGLRTKGGGARPELVGEAGENLVDFVDKRIKPLVEKEGIDLADSLATTTFLTEKVGFSMSGARAYADILASQQSNEIKRQREAARRVNLDAQLGRNTYMGATQALTASFDTAVARNLDKFAPVFAKEIDPVTQAINEAGKLAEQGDLATASKVMLRASQRVLEGPAGDVIKGIALADATKTLLTTADPMSKAGALLQIAAVGLTEAASVIAGWFGEGGEKKKEEFLWGKEGEDSLTRNFYDNVWKPMFEEKKPAEGETEKRVFRPLDPNVIRAIQGIPPQQPIRGFTNEEYSRLLTAPSKLMDGLQAAWKKAGETIQVDKDTEEMRKIMELEKRDREQGLTKDIQGLGLKPTDQPMRRGTAEELARLDAEWAAQVSESFKAASADFGMAFAEGSAQASTTIVGGLTTGGATLAGQIQTAIAAGGVQLAGYLQSAVANVRVNVSTQTTGSVDTGPQVVQ